MDGIAGETSIETRVAEVTVRSVDPDMSPSVAEIVVVPAATAVAMPSVPEPLLIVAFEVSVDDHTTEAVRSWVVSSENVPVAVNDLVVPAAIVVNDGSTSIDKSVAELTVNVVLAVIKPRVAVIVVAPAATAVANPSDPSVLSIVAFVISEDVQVTAVVISCVEKSEYVPTAV